MSSRSTSSGARASRPSSSATCSARWAATTRNWRRTTRPATMPIEINATHDPARRSWVESANAPSTDFPIQNLPFGVFRTDGAACGGVALGDFVIDLGQLHAKGALSGGAADAAYAASGPSLAPLLDCSPAATGALRDQLSELFRQGGT